MKRQIQKRLTLSKETLRNLSEREMQGAVGGATFTGLCCSGGVSSCCTDDSCAGTCHSACSQASGCC
jgi:hypothetical protein